MNANGSILISNSNYSGTRFYTLTIKKPWNIGAGLTFQGFIYPPGEVAPVDGSGFRFDNLNYPTTIRKGNYFTLYGTMYSRLPMKRVEVGIVSASTKRYVYHYDNRKVNGAKWFNIHNADATMQFRKLGKGTYYYRIWAWDKNGANMVLNKKFTVK